MDSGKVGEVMQVLPLALIAGITPLIVRYKKVPLGEVAASYWVDSVNTDFFSYYKMWWFLGCVLLALLSFYIYYRRERQKLTLTGVNQYGKQLIASVPYYLPALVYMVMVVLSTVVSECRYTSLYGFPDRYQGMPVLLGYMLVILLTVNLVKSRLQIRVILAALLIGAVIIGIIGIYQFFEMDFLQSRLARQLMIPESGFEQITSRLNFRFDGRNIIYATLYNPNYAGSYFVMMLMLSLMLYLFASSREQLILYGAISSLMFACWLGSLSRAGILGGLVSGLVMSVLPGKRLFNRSRRIVILAICFLLIFLGMNFYTGGTLAREFLSLGRETKVALTGELAKFRGFKTVDNSLVIETDRNQLTLTYKGNKPGTEDTDPGARGPDRESNLQNAGTNNSPANVEQTTGTVLEFYKDEQKLDYTYNQENKEIKFTDKNIEGLFRDFKFRFITGLKLLEMHYADNQVLFMIDDKGFWVSGLNDGFYRVEEVDHWGFEGREGLATHRGYIWSRSLPLLKETIVTGFGPDTYAIYFPQHDYSGKFKAFGTTHKIVDKPHNMYLQVAINTGIISLLALLAIFGLYLVRSLKLYWNWGFDDFYSRVGAGLIAAVIGYLVAGFFNDSVISVAPVFWVLLGLGIAVNIRLRKELKKEVEASLS